MSRGANHREVLLEGRKLRTLARVVDGAVSAIARGECLDQDAARLLARRVRQLALALFPGKEDTFDLIYRPRLERALKERFRLH